MYHFRHLGLPLGAVLNQEKTRVMTSRNGHKLTDLLKTSGGPYLRVTGDELSHVIRKNSTKDGTPHEITDSIRVLGTPVRNVTFCKRFISPTMDKVREHSNTILDRLPRRQSALQLYKFCASHKMTHLFGADILTIKDYTRN